MTVVINEFEVVAEPPPKAGPTGPATPGSAAAQAPTPHDIDRILRRQRERFARIRAH